MCACLCVCVCLCTCMSVCMCMLIYLCACMCPSTCVEVRRQLAEVISTIRVAGNELGSLGLAASTLKAPSLFFSDSFASSDFPGGTQGLASLCCMPLMTHLYHVCPHTWFMHGSPAWREGLKALSSCLVLSPIGKYKEAIKSLDIGRLKTQSLTLKSKTVK